MSPHCNPLGEPARTSTSQNYKKQAEIHQQHMQQNTMPNIDMTPNILSDAANTQYEKPQPDLKHLTVEHWTWKQRNIRQSNTSKSRRMFSLSLAVMIPTLSLVHRTPNLDTNSRRNPGFFPPILDHHAPKGYPHQPSQHSNSPRGILDSVLQIKTSALLKTTSAGCLFTQSLWPPSGNTQYPVNTRVSRVQLGAPNILSILVGEPQENLLAKHLTSIMCHCLPQVLPDDWLGIHSGP